MIHATMPWTVHVHVRILDKRVELARPARTRVLSQTSSLRQRVQSDLLGWTAFDKSVLVACTKGPLHNKCVDILFHLSTSWGQLTRPLI